MTTNAKGMKPDGIYRAIMCRIGIWFLSMAGITIVDWEDVEQHEAKGEV